MFKIREQQRNPGTYDVLVGSLDHPIGTIAREAWACYAFKPVAASIWTAAFLSVILEIVQALNAEDEEKVYLAISRELN